MKETIPILFLLLLMASACWYIVLSKRFRKKMQRPSWRLHQLDDEKREMYDAMYFAGFLVAAIALTILFVVSFVLAISRSP